MARHSPAFEHLLVQPTKEISLDRWFPIKDPLILKLVRYLDNNEAKKNFVASISISMVQIYL